MSYYKPKKKNNWLSVVGIVLVVVLCLSIFGVFKNDDDIGEDYTRVRPGWTVGTITQGSFDSTVANHLLSDLIPVNDGIKILVDLDTDITYTIHMYNESKNYMSNYQSGRPFEDSEEISLEELTQSAADPDNEVKYVRIELLDLDDTDINSFDKIKYTKDLTIYTLKTAE